MVQRTTNLECPSAVRLQQFLNEELASSDCNDLERHVEECYSCQGRLAELTQWKSEARTGSSSRPAFRPDPNFLFELCEQLTSTASANSKEPDPLPAIPGYELVRELGYGGTGVVYLARDVRLNRPVALKLLRLTHTQARFRLLREAEATARVQHPNIVRIYEVGESEGRPYIAMEYVDGSNLQRKYGGRSLPPGTAAELVEQLARAVQAAHAAGIVHRDLKPANVLIADDSTLKIADFGLAKILEEPDALTHTGQLLGTPGYVPPEQLAPDGRITPSADIYALGAILYELLTGRPPFRAGRPLDTLIDVVYREPVSPAKLAPRVSRDLETICLTCLNKNPSRRYPSAAEFADDLARCRAGKPVRARPVGWIGKASRWARRKPAAASLAALGAASVVFAIGGLTWLWQQSAQLARVEADAKLAAQSRSVDLAFDRALTMCEQGEVARGLQELSTLREQAAEVAPHLDRPIRWNLETWQHYHAPRAATLEHPSLVRAIAFSPDGNLLLTGGSDGVARLWDPATGTRVGGDLGRDGSTNAVAFSPTGKSFVTVDKSGTAQIWDLPLGKQSTPPLRHGSSILAVAFSPDGKFLITGGADGRGILWDAKHGDRAGLELHHDGAIEALAFAPDGKSILTGSTDGTARLWESESGHPMQKPFRHAKPVRVVAFAPDGRTYTTGSAFGFVGTWPPEANDIPPQVKAFALPAPVLAFDPSGRFLVIPHGKGDTGGGGVTVVRPQDDMTARMLTFKGIVESLAVGPKGRSLLAGGGPFATLWLEPGEREYAIPLEQDSDVGRIALDPTGRWAATVGKSGHAANSVQLWSIPASLSGEETIPLAAAEVVVAGPNGQVFSAGNRRARIWSGPNESPEWSYKGRLVAANWIANECRCWIADGLALTCVDASTGKSVGEPIVVRSDVESAVTSPDGRRIAIRDRESAVGIYRTDDPSRVAVTFTGSGPAMAFDPRGPQILASDASGKLWIRSVDTGIAFGDPIELRAPATLAKFAPNGEQFAVACRDKSVVIYDTSTRRATCLPLQHSDALCQIEWAHDGNVLATVCTNGSVRLWDATGKPIGPAIPRMAKAIGFARNVPILCLAGSREITTWRVPK